MGQFQTIVTVYNSEGEAVEGALVDITNADYSGKTNSDGEFEFLAASKEITYKIKATRYGSSAYGEVRGGKQASLRFK